MMLIKEIRVNPMLNIWRVDRGVLTSEETCAHGQTHSWVNVTEFIFDHTYIRICMCFHLRGPFVRAAVEPMEMRCPAVCQPWPPATHNDPCVSVAEPFF